MKAICVSMLIVTVAMARTAYGTDKTFNQANSTWNSDGNWTPPGVPAAGDKVTIPSGKTCHVDITTAQCDYVVVESTATLEVDTAKGLELVTSTNPSTIDGSLNLYGELILDDVGHTFGTASGKVVGKHANALITMGTKNLTNKITMEGQLTVSGSGGTEIFKNDGGTVHANTSGTLYINMGHLQDTATAVWKVSTNGSAVLRLNHSQPDFEVLFGDFDISTGLLDIDGEGFKTKGSLIQTAGVVDVAAGGLAYLGFTE